MSSILVNDYRLTALSDGISRLPPLFFPGLDRANTAQARILTAPFTFRQAASLSKSTGALSWWTLA
jgi:hypothetical protein